MVSYSTTGQKSSISFTEFTIHTVITQTGTGAAHQRIYEQGGANAGGGVDIETNATNDHVSCFIWNSDGTAYLGATAPISQNTRIKVTCSYDGDAVGLYIDGTLVDSLSGLTLLPATTDIFIGEASSIASGNRNFEGTIERVDVYDQALSATAISDLATE